jgi:alkanesulfonate monooxygenase SsuD/methylene tetrahydromethanopterin reductase-like flavin-dependent oxidoreductase (luciferase family)
MEIDLILDARASADELAELGQMAESYGIRGVWVSSLLDGRDPFSNFSVLARATERICMGPIAVNPWDMHPVRIASALLTLNELSDGRARIVIGGGGEALASLGLKPERRVRAVRECIEIIQQVAGGERFDYQGELYEVSGFHLNWLKSASPPVYAAANQEQMLRMSSRVADGIMMSDLPPRLSAAANKTIGGYLQDFGRSSEEFWLSGFTAWHVYADEQQARQEAARWLLLRGLFRPWVLREFLSEADCELVMQHHAAFLQAFINGTHVIEGVPERVVDSLVDNLTLTASTDNLDSKIEKLQQYSKAGMKAVSLRLYTDPAASIKLLGERVVPVIQ